MQITTNLPSTPDDVEDPQTLTLKQAVSAPLNDDVPALVLLVLGIRLISETSEHHRWTSADKAKNSTAAADYNFCLEHKRLEVMISRNLSSLTSIEACTEVDRELRVLALIITYGARIALYQTAIVNIRKVSFLASAAEESRRISSAAATSISDLLLRAKVLNPSQVILIPFAYLSSHRWFIWITLLLGQAGGDQR